MVIPNASQLAAMSRFFSSAVFLEMARRGRSALFSRLLNYSGLYRTCAENTTVADAFDAAFATLKREGLRDEYIYRAALTHKILLGKHSLNTACILTEFRIGSCKADLVILNGTATAYEIKSERDSLTRLVNQVTNYKKMFSEVNVIASAKHVNGILESVPEDVGVMCLSHKYSIRTIREAQSGPDRICPATVFESLRHNEACSILKKLGKVIPDVPNTKMHAVMREIFSKLDPAEVHAEMVKTLKRTRSLAPLSHFIDRLPVSLHAAALSIQVRQSEHDRLVKAISTPLTDALAWA
jgi:hypothetical protein